MVSERRRRERLRLSCGIRLSQSGRAPVKTRTENLSSTGFYCTIEEPISPGERLECELSIPRYDLNSSDCLVLRRRVAVVRLEIKGVEPGFGIACQFEEQVAI
jgi:hypothetical protein